MNTQENYFRLNEDYVTSDSPFQQQQSDTWFETHKKAMLTGSTLNAALGLSTLKKTETTV
jgi:hypothetical protein